MNVVPEAVGMALACPCQAWSPLRKVQAKPNETSMLFKTPTGYVHQSPLVGIVGSYIDTVTKLGQGFGLTPASRGRLKASESRRRPAEKSVWGKLHESCV